MAIIDTRRNQMYPVLDAAQIATASRFASGPARDFAPGEPVFTIGLESSSTWLVLKGSIDVTRHDGLNGIVPVMTELPGHFSGEISQLSGRGSLAEGHAGPEGCTALPFDQSHLRALLIGSAELGEIVMRAFILRRVALLEAGGSGAVLVGRPGMPELTRLQNFLRRNSYPFTVLDASDDVKGRALV
jgi:thioredoxin reductase (NADPH)